ncbi:MAG: hypothetical protein ACRENG_24005 [bacterium]
MSTVAAVWKRVRQRPIAVILFLIAKLGEEFKFAVDEQERWLSCFERNIEETMNEGNGDE